MATSFGPIPRVISTPSRPPPAVVLPTPRPSLELSPWWTASTSTATLTEPSRIFNASTGQLVEIEDANGNALDITYNEDGTLASVYDAADPSRSLTFTDTGGHITAITDFTGRIWKYCYQTAVNPVTDQTVYLLTSVHTPCDSNTPAQTTNYGYDTSVFGYSSAAGSINASSPLFGLLSSVTNVSDGASVQISYYPDGRAFTVTLPDGGIESVFYDTYHDTSTYVNELGQPTLVEMNSAGDVVKQINPDLTQIDSTYNANGELTSETNAMGQTETFTYDSSGNVTSYTAFDGVTTDATYNSFAEPTQVTLPGGRVTTYTYDSHGNLLSMTDAAGDETTYTYVPTDGTDHTNGLVETVTAPNGNVEGATASDFTTTFTYNTAGQTVTAANGLDQTVTNTYDSAGDLTSMTDAMGNTTSYTYNLLGQLLSTTSPDPGVTGETQPVSNIAYDLADNSTTTTDPNGNITQTFFNGDNQVIKVVNPDGSFISYAYGAASNLVAMTDSRGNATKYVYNSMGQLVETLNPDGTSTTQTYNAAGQVTSSTDADGNTTYYSYQSNGWLASVTDPNGNITTYGYDSVGDVTSVTTPLGTTTYTYDDLGRVTQSEDPTGLVTETTYDADGNVTQQTQYNVSDPSDTHATTTVYDVLDRPIEVTDPAGNHTDTSYNADGEVISTTDAAGATTNYAYDDDGRLISTTGPSPDGGTTPGPVTSYLYDADGNQTEVTDPLGNTTAYIYNNMNELISETDPAPSTGAAAPVTTYQYNTDGEQTAITDPDGNTTFYQFNFMGEQVSELNAAGSKWTWQYDPNGNLISATDADGRTVDYTYNSLGEVTSENWVGGDYTINYTYNSLGQLTQVTDPDSTYNYTYNSVGQVIHANNSGTPGVPTTTLNTSYDGFNNLASLSALIGSTTDFTNSYSYDSLADMTQVAQSGSAVTSKQANFTYNALGQITSEQLSASSAVANASFGYNDADQLTSLTYTRASDSSTINSYGLTYNSDGQITAETNSDGTIDYTYDHDGQLTGASGSGLPSSNSYSYDANGDRTSTGSAADTTGTNNELTSDGTYDYTYDADGNPITQTTIATGATENFTWDYRNRLTGIVFKNSSGVVTEEISYTYDAFNQRISQTVKNGSGTVTFAENYVYDSAGDLVMTLDASGSVTDTFLNGPTGQTLAADAGSGNVTWLLADQQGSVRDVINDSGAVVDHIVYDSYGNIVSQSSSANQPRFAYAGMQLDQATGLYYDHARYYDSSTGTFINQDPTGFGGGTTDLYDYVGNDPVNFDDPTGTFSYRLQMVEEQAAQGDHDVLTQLQNLMLVPPTQSPACFSGDDNGATTGSNGGTVFSNAQQGDSWWSNFWNAGTNPNSYGEASNVTQPNSIVYTSAALRAAGVVLVTYGTGGIAAEVYDAYVSAEEAGIAASTVASAVGNAAIQATSGQPFSWTSFVASTVTGAGAGVAANVVGNMLAAESEGAAGSTPVGRSGSPLGSVQGNADATIGGRTFSGHALDGMQADGIPPSVAENTIQNGSSMVGKNPGTTAFYDPANNVTVITNSTTGKVVTVSRGLIKQ